MKYRIYP